MVGENLLGRALCKNMRIVEQDNAVRPAVGVVGVVGGNDDGDALLCQLLQNIVDHPCVLWVQCAERFVQDEQLRSHHQNVCDGYPLFLPTA